MTAGSKQKPKNLVIFCRKWWQKAMSDVTLFLKDDVTTQLPTIPLITTAL
jgi:hypothetical protein